MHNIAVTNDGKIVSFRDNSYFSVAEPLNAESIAKKLNITKVESEGISSKIPTMPYEQWLQIVGFHRWSYKTFKKETHLSHFITKEGKFITLPFHQEATGMSIKIELNSPENQALIAQLTEEHGIDIGGFHGTTHNHVAMAAFQSTTDNSDEAGQQGIHFTLGELHKPEMSIHARVSAIFNGDISQIKEGSPPPPEALILKKMITLSPISILSFIDIPHLDKNFKEMPKEYIDAAMKRYVTGIGFHETLEFPEEWKARVTEKKYLPAQQWAGSGVGAWKPMVPAGVGNVGSGTLGGAGQNKNLPPGQTNPSGSLRTIKSALENKFHTGFQTLFQICAYHKNLKPVDLKDHSPKTMMHAMAVLSAMDVQLTAVTPDELLDFAEVALRTLSVNSPAQDILDVVTTDSAAWDAAWNTLKVEHDRASSIHSYTLSRELAARVSPSMAEQLLS